MSITLSLYDIKKAQENLKGIVRKTPLFHSSTFSKDTGYEVYLKCENKQKLVLSNLEELITKLHR